MNLVEIGATGLEPETVFFWDRENNATVEVTELPVGQHLVRASKTYRLVKQDVEGQESWDRNLPDLNDELASTFSSFRISIDYTDSTTSEVLGFDEEAEELVEEAQHLKQRSKELENKREKLENGLEHGLEDLKDTLQRKHENTLREEEQARERLSNILQYLEDRKRELNQWGKNGVSTAYLFQFSTDPEIIPGTRLEETVDRHLDEVFDLHRRKVKQVLQGPKFKLHVDELEEPRVFNRLEHTQLLNPEGFDHLLDEAEDTELREELKQLKRDSARQYMAVALNDIEVDGATVQRAKSTPARAVSSVLQNLEAEKVANPENVPNNGPMIGTVAGKNQVVGFDPAELPHYYIMGETGSGKSYAKTVFVENVASLGYDLLTISPSDTEEIGLSLPNPDHDEGIGINIAQYWIGDNQLLDKPDDIDELFTGLNAVTLAGLDEHEKQDYVNEIFSRLTELDRSSKPLFVFLEEAHNFNQGEAADAIQELVREARKFGIHVVVVSQNPMDFSHSHRHVRENTVSVFLRGEYTEYASDFLDDASDLIDLATGRAIINSPSFSQSPIDIRKALTKPTAPTQEEIQRIDQRYRGELPDLEDTAATESLEQEGEVQLSKDEEQLLEYIKDYIEEHDERPSKSKCYRPDTAPFGSSKTTRLLDQLLEKEVIQEETVERYGNESQVYSPI